MMVLPSVALPSIEKSDMKLVPDLINRLPRPFRDAKTLIVNFRVVDPLH